MLPIFDYGYLHAVYPWLKRFFLHGAVFDDSGEAGTGDVIRNSWGDVLASLLKHIPNSLSIATLELLAPRKPAMFVQEVGIGSSIFEGDYEVFIKVLDWGN